MHKKNSIIVLFGIILAFGIVYLLPKLLIYSDVIKNESILSFNELVDSLENNVSYNKEVDSWEIKSLDNSAYLYISKDFSKSSLYDVMIKISIEPFIKAGLDTKELTLYNIENGYIYIGININDEQEQNETISLAYKNIVTSKRNILAYHQQMDHFGINLGNGNMFEWAKKLNNNDKDIVFVLNIEPFVESGVDLKRIDGWLYAKVPVMKENKIIEVEKLIKAFNIK